MPRYTQWLQIYADSDRFLEMIPLFFGEYGHTVDSAPQANSTECYDLYYSDVCVRCYERLDKKQGDAARPSYWIHLPDTRSVSIHPYFSSQKNEEQLFALTFALWWGLKEKQVRAVDRAPQPLCLDALNYFLCEKEAVDLPEIQELKLLRIHPKSYLRRCSDGDPRKESWITGFDPYAEMNQRYGF